MAHSFEDAMNNILRRHDEYAPEVYDFLRQAMNTTARQYNRDEHNKHLSAEELYMGVCALALEEFGPLAKSVMAYWGVFDGSDVGRIVFYMVEAGIFRKEEDDNMEQFLRLPSMSTMLDTPYCS